MQKEVAFAEILSDKQINDDVLVLVMECNEPLILHSINRGTLIYLVCLSLHVTFRHCFLVKDWVCLASVNTLPQL